MRSASGGTGSQCFEEGALKQPEQPSVNLTQAFKELVQIGITLTSERDLATLLERILSEARRFTRAEAGTLFLREGDLLHFAVVQNDRLAGELGLEEMKHRLQEQPLHLRELSLAGHVALTGDILNLHDTYMIPPDRPYRFDASVDARTNYRTQSILVVPLQEPSGTILGVLELINAVDHGRIVPFDTQYESLVRALASQAAVAIRNARLEDLSFKDALTDVYNRRYFMIRMEEEYKRHKRFGEPLSLALLDVDRFKDINDRFGHRAGDEALRDIARLLLKHSRSFSVVTRYGGDEFAIILVNTAKAGAVTYAERIQSVVEQHAFRHGWATVSVGVASLPDDAASADDLIVAADRALYDAKRLGRNRVAG
jgi:diguanylate cyclase (GGDEF)-like protein